MQLGCARLHRRVLRPLLLLGSLALTCTALLACTEQDAPTSTERASDSTRPADAAADTAVYAAIFADESSWPVRVWLEEPLLDASGEVLVPARRMGVLMYLREDGEARIDFGRFGPHTVPARQTNLASEAGRVRAGEASKPFPNLVAMLATRMVDSTSEELLAFDGIWDGSQDVRVLLVFADPSTADVSGMEQLLSPVQGATTLWQTVLVPISNRDDAALHAELRAQGWTSPFVVSSVARSYVPAMLEPQSPRPLLRLSSANGRVLVEGPPTEATMAAIAAALDAPAD